MYAAELSQLGRFNEFPTALGNKRNNVDLVWVCVRLEFGGLARVKMFDPAFL